LTGGVVVASLVDTLTGHSVSHSTVSERVPTQAATGSTATLQVPGPVEAGGTIVFGREIRNPDVVDGLFVVAPRGRLRRTITTGAACCPSWSRAGDLLVSEQVPDHRGIDVVIHAAGSGHARIRITDGTLSLGPGVWSPSGARVAVWGENPSDPASDGIYARGLAGVPRVRVTTATGGRMQQPLAYSPDGIRILFYQPNPDDGAGSVYVVRADGTTHPVRLTPRGMTSWCCYFGSPASWGPNDRVTFAAFAPGAAGENRESGVYVVNADGSHLQRITTRTFWITSAHWSADGSWIVFDQSNRAGGAHDLFLVHPDGTGLHMINSTTNGNGSCCAQWSPNSKTLLYSNGPTDQSQDLWTVNIDGSGARRLTHAASNYLAYTWGP
jgi:Tol biopolymer transport system component